MLWHVAGRQWSMTYQVKPHQGRASETRQLVGWSRLATALEVRFPLQLGLSIKCHIPLLRGALLTCSSSVGFMMQCAVAAKGDACHATADKKAMALLQQEKTQIVQRRLAKATELQSRAQQNPALTLSRSCM